MHNKCSVLESSRKHPRPQSAENCPPQNHPLVPKRLGTTLLGQEGVQSDNGGTVFTGDVSSADSQEIKGSHFPGGSDGKASVYNAGDLGSIPGLGRSSGEGNGNPLQYHCLENPMDRGAW